MTKPIVFDAADYLDSEEVIAEYLNVALSSEDPDRVSAGCEATVRHSLEIDPCARGRTSHDAGSAESLTAKPESPTAGVLRGRRCEALRRPSGTPRVGTGKDSQFS